MLKVAGVVAVWLVTLPAFCQSGSKYQVATIMEVKEHKAADNKAADVTKYDVTLKVGDTLYVALYTPPLGESTVKYAAGREILVLVGEKTITYNDILGKPFEGPIESRKPATPSK